jgi:hypothetical protein
LALSTMIVRTPLAAMCSSMAAKPGRASIGSAPLTARQERPARQRHVLQRVPPSP